MTNPPITNAPITYPAGTLDLKQIEDGFFQWVKEITQGIIPDSQILWRNQSEPLPPRPCVTMKIIDGPTPTDRNGSLFFNPKSGQTPPTSNQNPNFNVGMQMEMTVSIQVFGNKRVPRPRAIQLTLDLNSSLIRQSILDKLKKAGISIQGKSQVRNLTALEETEYEERAGFDINVGLVQNVLDQPGTIETVNMTIENESDSGHDDDSSRTVQIKLTQEV